jgi:hypothetical protein
LAITNTSLAIHARVVLVMAEVPPFERIEEGPQPLQLMLKEALVMVEVLPPKRIGEGPQRLSKLPR